MTKAITQFRIYYFCLLLNIFLVSCILAQTKSYLPGTNINTKPWTRWWWPGSAVDKENLTKQLEELARVGVGGVEITPIYGARGYEDHYIEFLSPEWIEMLEHVCVEANRLGLGVDMATGTGWPFGGPWISEEIGNTRAVLKDGKLTGKPELQKVKRAAPGGEGLVLNPYSSLAMKNYLKRFDEAFKGFPLELIRGQFHDSFEYYNASWVETFPKVFYEMHGYDVQDYALEIMGEKEMDSVSLGRIKSDYREALSELHMDYLQTWVSWCNEKGFQARNQSHGAPANLLDLYAIADIPETEVFGSTPFTIPGLRRDRKSIRHDQDVPEPLVTRMASSAAHVMGKPLVSSESCTWLRDHWKVTLAYVKPELDRILLDGINHIFYHGTVYSPQEVPWPGWLFYASTQFNPNNPWWDDFSALNAYVQRVQTVLQEGVPDNDILLYWPIYDIWDNPQGLMQQLTVHKVDFVVGTPFGNAAKALDDAGFSFDYISDAQLMQIKMWDGKLVTPGNQYKVLVVPVVEHMSVKTMQQVLKLVKKGAHVIFQKLPEDVPGFGKLEHRRIQLEKLCTKIADFSRQNPSLVSIGDGSANFGINSAVFKKAGVFQEAIAETPVDFIRRATEQGHSYFFANLKANALDGWITLGAPAAYAVISDPLTGKKGTAALRQNSKGKAQIYLQLQPGQSLLVEVSTKQIKSPGEWFYLETTKEKFPIKGRWQIEFIKGGPELPSPFNITNLASWTEQGDAKVKSFAGTARYTIEFELPEDKMDEWILDLGDIRESARLFVNGHKVNTLWSIPFKALIGAFLKTGKNRLEIEVTNVAANRIRGLDLKGIDWKIMHEINFVNILYKPFDASNWEIEPAGLLGPVTITAIKNMKFK
jgi:hypothetical protein